jgi:hypothetical protein
VNLLHMRFAFFRCDDIDAEMKFVTCVARHVTYIWLILVRSKPERTLRVSFHARDYFSLTLLLIPPGKIFFKSKTNTVGAGHRARPDTLHSKPERTLQIVYL